LVARNPVHVTVKLREGLPSLRRRAEMTALTAAYRAGYERPGFRLVHYAVPSNQMHFVVEGKDRMALSRGTQGLLVRVARARSWLLRRGWRRHGLLSP